MREAGQVRQVLPGGFFYVGMERRKKHLIPSKTPIPSVCLISQ